MSASTATRLARWVAAALAAAAVAVLVVHLAGEEAQLTPRSLAASLARATGAPVARCVHGRGAWMCGVRGRRATYLVTQVDDRCWRASLAGDGGPLPRRAAACVTPDGHGVSAAAAPTP